MEVAKPIRTTPNNFNRMVSHVRRSFPYLLLQVASVEELHCDKGKLMFLIEFVDLNHVGVTQGCPDFRLVSKLFDFVAIFRLLGQENLHSNSFRIRIPDGFPYLT